MRFFPLIGGLWVVPPLQPLLVFLLVILVIAICMFDEYLKERKRLIGTQTRQQWYEDKWYDFKTQNLLRYSPGRSHRLNVAAR